MTFPAVTAAAPLHDPAGLLSRSPELAELSLHAPALRRAIERGRPFDAHRALFWASTFGRFKGDQAVTAKALLAHRRIFYKPLGRRAPAMITFNGVGTKIYGKADLDRNDATYVTTLFLVFLFVPVFPIGSYLVRDANNNGRRAWSFMAKVPTSALTFLWQRGIAAGALVMMLVAASSAFEGYGHNTLHVVNGLDRPVTAELSGSPSVLVAPGSEIPIRTKVGKHAITIKDGDRKLESESVDVPRGRGAVVWNVLGAAPLYADQVVYSDKGTDGPEGSIDVFCGDSFVVKDGIDYAFVDPPKSIEMPEHSSATIKTHMAVAKGGLDACTGYLASHGQSAKAAHIFLRAATASKTSAANLGGDAEQLVAMAPHDEAEAFTKDLLSRDDSVEAHRIYQDWLLSTDQRDRAIAEYDARAKARPNDDGDTEYLALRVHHDADERPSVDAAVARHPRHAFLRHMQIYAHRIPREFDVVAMAAGVLHELDAKLWTRDMDEHVEALVATGHAKDALDLLDGTKEGGAIDQGAARRAQFLAYRVGRTLGKKRSPPEAPDDSDGVKLAQRLTAGADVSMAEIELLNDKDWKTALLIAHAARVSPNTALQMVREAPAPTLHLVPTTVTTLLLAEAARRGDGSDVVEKLADSTGGKKIAEAIATYVRSGTPDEELSNLPLEMQAAIDFGRSRADGLSAKEHSESLARAKQADVLLGPVSVAIDGWRS